MELVLAYHLRQVLVIFEGGGAFITTDGAFFSFPYPLSGKQVENAKKIAKDLFFNNKLDKQIHSLGWLVKKFWPVPGWDAIPDE
jgi:hypothetical protein